MSESNFREFLNFTNNLDSISLKCRSSRTRFEAIKERKTIMNMAARAENFHFDNQIPDFRLCDAITYIKLLVLAKKNNIN